MGKSKKHSGVLTRTYSWKVVVGAFVLGYICSAIILYSMNTESSKTPSKQPSASQPAPTPTASPLAALQARTQTHPDDPASWAQLGHYYFDTHQFQPAIQAYEKSLSLNRANPSVLVDCGVMYRRIKNPQQAVKLFQEALVLQPDHLTALYNLGIVFHFDLQDSAQARTAWSRLLELNPQAKGPGNQTLRDFMDTMDLE